MKDGFIKVAAASPVIKVADCDYNAERIIECIREAEEKGVKVLVFPELTLTGASCWDLFRHRVILDGAERPWFGWWRPPPERMCWPSWVCPWQSAPGCTAWPPSSGTAS